MNHAALTLVALTFAGAEIRAGRTPGGIAYDVQGTGPAVVLVSGSNLDRRMWAAEAEWLKERFTVIRYDLRAHGQSDSATAPFAHVEDLIALLDELRVKSAMLVGLSAGSTIALDAALLAPDRITGLVLAAPAIGGFVPKDRPAFFSPLMAALQAGDYARAQEVMLASPLLEVPETSRVLVRTMVTENNRLWTVPREMMKASPRPAAGRLEEIRVPVLVLVGERDLAPQREQAEVLARRISGARLVIVPDGGHLLNLTSVNAFKAAVLPFLNAIDRP